MPLLLQFFGEDLPLDEGAVTASRGSEEFFVTPALNEAAFVKDQNAFGPAHG